jgi:hypothetical protein
MVYERRGAIILIALQRPGAIILIALQREGTVPLVCNNPYCTPERG